MGMVTGFYSGRAWEMVHTSVPAPQSATASGSPQPQCEHGVTPIR